MDTMNARNAIHNVAHDANVVLSQALADHRSVVTKLERALEQASIASRALAAIDPALDGVPDAVISRTQELEARAQKALFGVPVEPEEDSE